MDAWFSQKNYNEKCDVYSLGVTFFILVYGYHPFREDDLDQTLQNNQYSYIEFSVLETIPFSCSINELFISLVINLL